MTSPILPSNPALEYSIFDESNCPARNSSIKWESKVQEQIYSSNLLQSLFQFWQGGGSISPKQVQETANRILATTAKGCTRWSLAALTNKNRLRLKYMKKNNVFKRHAAKKKGKFNRIMCSKSPSLYAFKRKARFLKRLVPGCRKQPLPVVMEEAVDYIAALEMQVRCMRSLAEILTKSAGISTAAPACFKPNRKPDC